MIFPGVVIEVLLESVFKLVTHAVLHAFLIAFILVTPVEELLTILVVKWWIYKDIENRK